MPPGDGQRHALLGQTRADVGELDVDDLLDLRHAERMEHHDIVDTVEELGAEGLSHGPVNLMAHLLLVLAGQIGDSLGAHVGRHDDNRVLEGHLATLTVGQTAVVEHLQQHVKDIRMSLLHLVEQDHGVGTTAHGLGELAALVIAHVSRGRTDQTLDAELLHILGHVDTHERALVIEQALGQRLASSVLPTPVGPREEEAADGLVWSERPARLRRTAAATAETASS